MLRPNMFGSFTTFGERYCVNAGKQSSTPDPGRFWDKYRGSKNFLELNAVVHATLMIRRMKSEVLHELPEKFRLKVAISYHAFFDFSLNTKALLIAVKAGGKVN